MNPLKAESFPQLVAKERKSEIWMHMVIWKILGVALAAKSNTQLIASKTTRTL